MRALNRLCSFLILAALFLGPALPAAAQTGLPGEGEAPTAGPAGPADPNFGGDSMELVQQMGGSFRALDVEGSTAYLAIGQRVVVLDVSNKSSPKLAGQTDILSGPGANLDYAGGYAYVAEDGFERSDGSRGGSGLRIVDVRSRAFPQQSGYLSLSGGVAMDVAVNGNFAYVADGARGLWVVNVANPAAPVTHKLFTISSFDPFDIEVAQGSGANSGKLFAYLSSSDRLVVVDVTNPASPSVAGSYDMTFSLEDTAVLGGYAYLALETGLMILNVSNPAAIAPVYTPTPGLDAYQAVTVLAGRAYLMDAQGIKVYNVANPAAPQKIGTWPVTGVTALQVLAGIAYVTRGPSGFAIGDLGNPGTPLSLGAYQREGNFSGLEIQDDRLYTSSFEAGVQVFGLSNPAQPTLLGSFATTRSALEVVSSGQAYLKVAGGWVNGSWVNGGLRRLNVANPASIQDTGFLSLSGGTEGVDVYGSTAFVANLDQGLKIVNLSNPASLSLLGTFATSAGALDVAVGASAANAGKVYAYVALDGSGVQIVDVTAPASPASAGTFTGGLTLSQGAVVSRMPADWLAAQGLDGHDVIAVGQSEPSKSFLLVDVSNPAAPAQIAAGFSVDYTGAVTAQGAWLYTAGGLDGASVYVKDDIQLLRRGNYRWPQRVYDVAVKGSFVYAAGGESGLFVTWFGPKTWATIPAAGGSLDSSFDSTTYTFAAATFPGDVTITHRPRYRGNMPLLAGVGSLPHFFNLTGYDGQDNPVQPAEPFQITIHYTDGELGSLDESKLGLYSWTGSYWKLEPTSSVNTSANTISATPNHFSLWGVLDRGSQAVFLPLSLR